MDFDFNIETVGLVIAGVIAGFFTGMSVYRGDVKSLEGAVDHFQTEYMRLSGLLGRERNLNEGLTQELAAQAKLVK